jgi:hypothetical protein
MTDHHSDPPSRMDDEPETPTWLPALGFALLIGAGVAWAVTPPLQSATPQAFVAPSVTVVPAAPPAPSPSPQATPPPVPARPAAPPVNPPTNPLPRAVKKRP